MGFLFVVCFCLCICLIFIQPRVFQDTQICGLIYVINFAKFLANITSDISVLFFFLLLALQSCICYTFEIAPQFLNILFYFLFVCLFSSLFFFSFHFSLGCFFKLNGSSLDQCSLHWWAYERRSSFLLQWFWFLAFIFHSFLEFQLYSAYTILLCLHGGSFFCIITLKLIITI